MTTEYYTASGTPSTGSQGASANMRGEMALIEAGFAKLPPLATHGSEFVRVNAGATALESITAAAVRSAIGLTIGTNVEAWDADLDAIAALGSTGIAVRSALNTWTQRSVAGTANEITVSNGDGVSGNPTVSLPAALTFTGKTVTGGTFTNPANTTQALTDAATTAWDASAGAIATLLATNAVGNTRAMGAPSNLKAGGFYELRYTQDATGGRALTFPASFVGMDGGAMPACNTLGGTTTRFFFTSDGSSLFLAGYSHLRVAPIAAGRNIAARTNSGTPNTKFDMSADQLVLQDANGNALVVNSVSVTVDMGVVGANGIDAGVQALSTWYYGWVIAKPDGTVAGLGSTSATAPTMPSGYTFKALATAVRSNGSTQFVRYRQLGNRVYYESRQSLLSGGSGTIETSVSTATIVPPIAEAFSGEGGMTYSMNSGDNPMQVDFRVVTGANFMTLLWNAFGVSAAHNYAQYFQLVDFPNVSQNLFYQWTTLNAATAQSLSVFVSGFKLPLGGE